MCPSGFYRHLDFSFLLLHVPVLLHFFLLFGFSIALVYWFEPDGFELGTW